MDIIRVLLPRQYVSRWKNDEGHMLYVVLYVEQDSLELKKVFVPTNDFKAMEIKKKMGNWVELSLDEDEQGRTVLKEIKKVDTI